MAARVRVDNAAHGNLTAVQRHSSALYVPAILAGTMRNFLRQRLQSPPERLQWSGFKRNSERSLMADREFSALRFPCRKAAIPTGR